MNRVREVSGLGSQPFDTAPFKNLSGLGDYVPMIRHGYSREEILAEDVVALSISDVFKFINGRYQPIANSGDTLRDRFKISHKARVILVSVARDKVLERYWREREAENIPAALATLGVDAMTIPNFSFFTGGPRTQILWNRRRMEIVAAELSAHQIPIIPHLNALEAEDWSYWLGFLRLHPGVVAVAKEFQTGLKNVQAGEKAIVEMARLQDRLGREIHPIVIGGGKFSKSLAGRFSRVTIIDSTPFVKTVKRCSRNLDGRWASEAHDGPLDAMLQVNVRTHRAYVAKQLARGRVTKVPGHKERVA